MKYKIENRMYGDAGFTVVLKNGKQIMEFWSHDMHERNNAAMDYVQQLIEDDNWCAANRD